MEQLEINIVTADKNKEMKLTKKQIVVLLEALWDFKVSIQSANAKGNLRKRILENKEEEVEKLFNYLQNTIDYNFERQLHKCFKTSKKDDAGQETFSWL